ncbi:MAG: hypothetical protein LBE74_05050 [Treponema sp.]|jgi:hypothetical protein|nr:hypothetical protein [Treponema sp.]
MVIRLQIAKLTSSLFKQFVFIWLTVSALSLHAQQLPDYQKASMNVLFRFNIDEEFFLLAREAGDVLWRDYTGPFPDKEFWNYSIEASLSGVENAAQILRYEDGAAGGDPIAEATDQKIPIFIDIHVTGDINNGKLTVRYSIRELFSELNVLEKVFSERAPREEDLLVYFWLPIATDLRDFIRGALKPQFVVNGPPGLQVYGVFKTPFTIPDSGTIGFDISMPATFYWETFHKKYARRRGVSYVDKDNNVLDLPRQRFFPTSIDVGLLQGCFPEFWISKYAQNGWFFSIGVQQQIFGLFSVNSDGRPLETSFNSQRLVMPGLAVGWRALSLEKPYIPQFYFQFTAMMRLNLDGIGENNVASPPSFRNSWNGYWKGWGKTFETMFETSWFGDFSPFSFALALGYEWETPLYLKFFVEAGVSAFILTNYYEKSTSKGLKDTGFIQEIVGDSVYFELPVFKVGVRLMLPF